MAGRSGYGVLVVRETPEKWFADGLLALPR
jgi:lipid-binding SYLF domain-containing protein